VLLEGGPATVEAYAGNYVKPALLAGSLDNVAAREEIFGPVAFLAKFSTEAEAIEMANNTDYGLANSVWTSDLKRAARVGEAMVVGNSWINAHNVFAHGVPYGGINKSGMGGGVLSIERLSTQTTLAPARPLGHHFIGIWSFDTTFAYDAVSLNVRYDEALAQSLGLPENILKLWVYDGELDHWARIMDGTFSRDLGEHTLHGAYTRGSIEYFAVSAPEPVGVFSFLVAGTAALLRRRRNYW